MQEAAQAAEAEAEANVIKSEQKKPQDGGQSGRGGGRGVRARVVQGGCVGLFWWICSLGWFAASTKWRIKFEIVRAGKIARVRQSESKGEGERKRHRKVAKKCHDKLWQKLCLLLLPLLLLLLLAACCKIWKNVCLSVPLCGLPSAKVCESRLLLMHTKYLCGIFYFVPAKVDLFCQLSFHPPPSLSPFPFAFLSSACHYAIDPTRSEYHILIIF